MSDDHQSAGSSQQLGVEDSPALNVGMYRVGYIASAISIAVAVGFGIYGWMNTEPGQQVAVHFNANGEPDGFGSRFEAFWILPLVLIAVGVVLAVLPRIDPLRSGVLKSLKAYNVIWAVVMVFLAGTSAMTTLAVVNETNLAFSGRLLAVLLAVVLIVIGNFMPKTGQNWFLGIRSPWTLSDDQVWTDTHRFGGALMMGVGAIALAVALFGPASWSIWVVVGASMTVGVVTYAYSYLRYRKLHSNG